MNLALFILFIAVGEEGEEVEDVPDQSEPVTGKKVRREEDFLQLFGPHYQSYRGSAAHSTTAAEEILDFFSLPQIPTMANPLQWWASNQGRFPRLANLSRKYLAVPATSTPSERIFSLAGNTITRKRASLHPAHVDALVFLHVNQEKTPTTLSEENIDSE